MGETLDVRAAMWTPLLNSPKSAWGNSRQSMLITVINFLTENIIFTEDFTLKGHSHEKVFEIIPLNHR
jgi:hypothetical protein